MSYVVQFILGVTVHSAAPVFEMSPARLDPWCTASECVWSFGSFSALVLPRCSPAVLPFPLLSLPILDRASDPGNECRYYLLYYTPYVLCKVRRLWLPRIYLAVLPHHYSNRFTLVPSRRAKCNTQVYMQNAFGALNGSRSLSTFIRQPTIKFPACCTIDLSVFIPD